MIYNNETADGVKICAPLSFSKMVFKYSDFDLFEISRSFRDSVKYKYNALISKKVSFKCQLQDFCYDTWELEKVISVLVMNILSRFWLVFFF